MKCHILVDSLIKLAYVHVILSSRQTGRQSWKLDYLACFVA